MKIIFFIMLVISVISVISVILFLLDEFIFKTVKHVMPISGDGKCSMNNFEMTE